MLLAMIEFVGKGGLRANGFSQPVDEINICGQQAIGGRVGLFCERDCAQAAHMVGAENDDQVGGEHGFGGAVPDLRIDRPTTLVIDVWRNEATAVPAA